jgi:micrococcal nuclease
MKPLLKHTLSFLLLLATLLPLSCNNSEQDKSLHYVMRVIDGDTFVIEDGTKKGEKIRLIGVDAPESRNTGRKKIGYYGKEAKKYLTNLLTGESVRLEYDVTRTDRYGRTLAYVYLADGTFLNAHLVAEGYAMVMTVPPNVKYAEDFVKLQRQARENNKGLWAK